MPHKNIAKFKQGSLGFFMPNPMRVGEFRDACSAWIEVSHQRACLSLAQANVIFNHAPDGRPRNALSPYRFTVNGCWGQVHAIGEEPMALLRSLADMANGAQALPAALQAPRWEERDVGLELSDGAETYRAPRLVVCRDAEQHGRWQSATTARKFAHVQDVLVRGLRRQAALLDLDVVVPDVEVVTVTRERAVPLLRGLGAGAPANAFVRLAAVGFTLKAMLHGHWAAGPLINRGFGSIQATHPQGLAGVVHGA